MFEEANSVQWVHRIVYVNFSSQNLAVWQWTLTSLAMESLQGSQRLPFYYDNSTPFTSAY